MDIEQYQAMSDTEHSELQALVDHLDLLDQCQDVQHQDCVLSEDTTQAIANKHALDVYKIEQNLLGCLDDTGYIAKQDQPESRESSRVAFEQYLQDWTNRENALYQKHKIKQTERRNQQCVRYIQKHRSPVTIFNYHGIDIQVRFQKYDNYHGSCLVMAYNKLDPQNIHKLINNRGLANAILHQLDAQSIRKLQQNQELFTFCCHKYFKNNNYNFLYLVRKPEYRYLAEYSAKKLGDNISSIIDLFCYYKNNESIVFADFDWTGLENKRKCQVFFWALLQAIQKQIKYRKVTLKRVTVCCENQNQFFDFTYQLRQISDLYMRNGLIHL